MQRWQIWIDTGGTFTDCIAIDPDSRTHKLKVLSSSTIRCRVGSMTSPTSFDLILPFSVPQGFFRGYELRRLGADSGVIVSESTTKPTRVDLNEEIPGLREGEELEICSPEEVPILAARVLTQTPLQEPLPTIDMRLGSTKGTNALLERRGAKVAFVVTKGFKDLLRIGNQQRPNIFSLQIEKPDPYYSTVVEVDERTLYGGEEGMKIVDEEVQRIVEVLKESQSESIAIGLLHSYRNPQHENLLTERLLEEGFRYVSPSSELSSSVKILPRAETAVANAYLEPIIKEYIGGIEERLGEGLFQVMTSAGGLVDANHFYPKDSLLSGPAGGLVGAVKAAKRSEASKIITFDMGGTSTDVARYDDRFDYRFETRVGDASIQSPALYIETIAAGGGSICGFDGFRFFVGPQSAGANPGPACYGAGGPLTITDVNVLSGRIDPANFGIPIRVEDAQKALEELRDQIRRNTGNDYSREQLLESLLQIANEKMAKAINRISAAKGFDPAAYTLVAFGGAGGQHACAIADFLGMHEIIIPADAGLLSARGIGQTEIERFRSRQVLQPLGETDQHRSKWTKELENATMQLLHQDGVSREAASVRDRLFYLRLQGQDQTIEIRDDENLAGRFRQEYERLFGHWVEGQAIELESIKVVGVGKQSEDYEGIDEPESEPEFRNNEIPCLLDGEWQNVTVQSWSLQEDEPVFGPMLIGGKTSTLFVAPGWQMVRQSNGNVHLSRSESIQRNDTSMHPEEAGLELFTNRLTYIAEDMGAMLQRTSFSVNIKERLDFSCAILDSDGFLVVNAPHIPVHLGGMGMCVRAVREQIELEEGDVIITNHPGFGGSHLPDITLISPVYHDGTLLGYVANRAHHAEIGGKRPGSMPPDAMSLEEEGVVIEPTYLMRQNEDHWEEIESILLGAKYPTRAPEENLADLKGAVASLRLGVKELQSLAEAYGTDIVGSFMEKIKDHAHESFRQAIKPYVGRDLQADEEMDNGARIQVAISVRADGVTFDFEGTTPTSPDNLNATPAITTSAILYVLRLLTEKSIPLNEGMLRSVEIKLPECFLNPDFTGASDACPAVVGGNTETSQRLVDTLLKAFNIAGCSQGTMNNLVFGNDTFGYYETICGGVGATDGASGADAVHQHMTNTRITDPEILELRYPVVLEEFKIREGSGGAGKWQGGDGVCRRLRFTEPVDLTILSQHRKIAPYGMDGGEEGAVGEQFITTRDGDEVELFGRDQYAIQAGDSVTIRTPGGGGFGKPETTP